MKISNKIAGIALAVIIIASLAVSTVYLATKQGYHEDELLNLNLSNSSTTIKTEGNWDNEDDFLEYLTPGENHRFDYAQVWKNQVIDAVHPPFYYAVVHTINSFFPDTFSRWIPYSVNLLAMGGTLLFLFLISRKLARDNLGALIATAAYALSIACFTTTIYLRMYASVTFFVTVFIYQIICFTQSDNNIKISALIKYLVVVTLGILTQYYFIVFAGLGGLLFLIFKIKDKHVKDIIKVLATSALGAAIALAVYPNMLDQLIGGDRGLGSTVSSVDAVTAVTYIFYKLRTYVHIVAKELFLGQSWLLIIFTAAIIGFGIFFRFVKKQKFSREFFLVVIPSFVYFIGIALVSPFNSDRYVMASLPFIAVVYALGFVKIFRLIPNERVRLCVPAGVLLMSVLGVVLVKPYYTYGTTNLYDIKTDKAVFVATPMLEWNKCVDKLMQYDEVLMVQTPEMSKTLGAELDEFATKRGVVTNGKISAMMDSYLNTGRNKDLDVSTLEKLSTDKKLAQLDEVTVYISRLADKESVIDYITHNTKFKSYELIQADKDFDEFFNWYDYFVETESYCNVYKFY